MNIFSWGFTGVWISRREEKYDDFDISDRREKSAREEKKQIEIFYWGKKERNLNKNNL